MGSKQLGARLLVENNHYNILGVIIIVYCTILGDILVYICLCIRVRHYCFPLMPAVSCRDLFGSSKDDSVLKSLQKEGADSDLVGIYFFEHVERGTFDRH